MTLSENNDTVSAFTAHSGNALLFKIEKDWIHLKVEQVLIQNILKIFQ